MLGMLSHTSIQPSRISAAACWLYVGSWILDPDPTYRLAPVDGRWEAVNA